jgi:NADH:ubiquinone oxidoreductase subunit E
LNTEILTGSKIKALQGIFDKYRTERGSTIPILQDLQDVFGYLPEEAVNWIADSLGIPRSSFFGIATFYSQFHLKPRGKNVLTVCCGTACHVKGSERILDKAQSELGLTDDVNTTADLNFTLEKVACLGTCSMAPAVVVNKKMHGSMKAEKLALEIRKLKKKS